MNCLFLLGPSWGHIRPKLENKMVFQNHLFFKFEKKKWFWKTICFSSLGLRWPQDGPKKEKQFILRLLMLLLLMMTYDNDDDNVLLLLMMTYDNDDDNDNDADNEFFVMLLCRIPHDLRGFLLLFFCCCRTRTRTT